MDLTTVPLRDHVSRFASSWSGEREGLVTVLEQALRSRDAPPAARAAARRLATAGSVAVVAGQQPAVGGGPLYDLAKAVHAVRLARELDATGQEAVAVFWCASEDHDLDEAARCDLLHRDGRLERFHGTLPLSGRSLRRQPVSAWWTDLLAILDRLEGPRLGADWWRERQPHDDEDLGTWFCRLLDALLGAAGLVVIQAHELRPLMARGLERALHDWPAEGLAERAACLRASGQPLAFADLRQPPLFDDAPTGRRAIDPLRAAQLLGADPLRLSPGAALRPVLQQLLLPAALYCGGPGELAYHRQLDPLYPALGALPPVLLPRLRLELLPAWWRRAVAAWGMDEADLRAETVPEPPRSRSIGELLARLDEAIAALADADGDADRRRRLATGRHRLLAERERLAASLERGQRQHQERLPLGALHAWLHPRERAQERVLSLAQACWQWGPGLAEEALEADTADGLISLRP